MSQLTVEGRLPLAYEDPNSASRDFWVSSPPAQTRTQRTDRAASSAFRLVIAGSSISMLGTKISTLAFPMLVLWLSRSPALAGLAIFATVIPGILLNFPAGIIVDKVNPWRVMVFSEACRGITAISIVAAILTYGRSVNIFLLVIAAFIEEVLEMFSTLAERRYLNAMMDPGETSERRSQQASIEARAHVAVLAGRPIAPFLFALNPLGPFLTDACSFAFSITGLLLGEGKWKQRESSPHASNSKSTINTPYGPPERVPGIPEALRSIRDDRTIWLGGPLLSMTSIVSQALILIFLTEANSHRFSTAVIGTVLAASGLGGAVGSYWSKFLPEAIRRRWIPIQLGAWLVTCAILALTGGHSAWAGGCTMFIFSVTGSIGNVEFSTYLNIKIQDNMLGKVSGAFYAISVGASAIGPVIGGYSIQQFGICNSVFILLGIVALMALCSVFLPPKALPEPFSPTEGEGVADEHTGGASSPAPIPREGRQKRQARFPGGPPSHTSQTTPGASPQSLELS